MNEKEKEYNSLSWFVAGYLAGQRESEAKDFGEDVPPWEIVEAARDRGEEAYSANKNGACLGCGREGLALMDGLFCGQCYPVIEEAMD